MTDSLVPGAVTARGEAVRINADRETVGVEVANTGDRPIQVGSHFHFFEVNRALEFDRKAAFGKRLDVPAGTAVRFEPGERKTVDLVAYGGERVVNGMNGLTNGPTDGEGDDEEPLERAAEGGFGGA
jgi:urease beta subunit